MNVVVYACPHSYIQTWIHTQAHSRWKEKAWGYLDFSKKYIIIAWYLSGCLGKESWMGGWAGKLPASRVAPSPHARYWSLDQSRREIFHTEQPAVYYEAPICSIVEGTLSTQASEGLVDMFKKVTEKELLRQSWQTESKGRCWTEMDIYLCCQNKTQRVQAGAKAFDDRGKWSLAENSTGSTWLGCACQKQKKRKRKHHGMKKTIAQIHGRSTILLSTVQNWILIFKLVSSSFIITQNAHISGVQYEVPIQVYFVWNQIKHLFLRNIYHLVSGKISTIWFLLKTFQIPSSSFLKCTAPNVITVTLLHNTTAHHSIFLLT